MTTVEQLKDALNRFLAEDEKFEKGNSSAGTRARKVIKEMSDLLKARKKEIQEVKAARKATK